MITIHCPIPQAITSDYKRLQVIGNCHCTYFRQQLYKLNVAHLVCTIVNFPNVKDG